MTNHFYIIPECFVDTNLISTLIDANVNHQKGCGAVAKIMSCKDEFCVGIIDKDKKQPSYIQNFTLIAKRNHLELYKHCQKPQYFIMINPAVESFILHCVKETGKDMSLYELPSSLPGLKKYTKKIDANKNPKISGLIRDIRDYAEIKALHSTLDYLINKKYTVDITKLKDIFLS